MRVSRILVKHVKALRCFSKIVPKHIRHNLSDEMSEKSEVAVIDVLHKNETCNKDSGMLRPGAHATYVSGGERK